MENISIKKDDFEKLFGETLSDHVKNKIAEYDLRYALVTEKEREIALIKIMEMLLNPLLTYAGPHRLKQWEKGWEENLAEFKDTKKTDDISPHYFGKYEINRLNGNFIKAVSPNYERNMVYVILDYVFDKYLRNYDNIYEFGCGTGHMLIKVREVNPTANLFGLDWATSSQKILKQLTETGILNKTTSYHFDFFHPDHKIKFAKNSAVYTVMALEQVGTKYKKFLSYLLKNKPEICIHVEPMEEFLDEDKLLDNLSITYEKKRNYLHGFLNYLRQLESEGKIQIHEAKRSNIGSFFVENSSIVVWSPKKYEK
jgi:hypothetical protein